MGVCLNDCWLVGDIVVGDNAGGRAGGDEAFHARADSYSRQEGRADTGGHSPILH